MCESGPTWENGGWGCWNCLVYLLLGVQGLERSGFLKLICCVPSSLGLLGLAVMKNANSRSREGEEC